MPLRMVGRKLEDTVTFSLTPPPGFILNYTMFRSNPHHSVNQTDTIKEFLDKPAS